MLLHAEYADASRRRQRLLLPVKLRLKPAPALFTRRFEAQLHWYPLRTSSRYFLVSRTAMPAADVNLAISADFSPSGWHADWNGIGREGTTDMPTNVWQLIVLPGVLLALLLLP